MRPAIVRSAGFSPRDTAPAVSRSRRRYAPRRRGNNRTRDQRTTAH